MKTLKEALFSRKNLKSNPFRLTENDLKGALKGFPMGIVVRMLEEQELQGNDPDVEVFQKDLASNRDAFGFDWEETEARQDFWLGVLFCEEYKEFFEKYPEYVRYNLT